MHAARKDAAKSPRNAKDRTMTRRPTDPRKAAEAVFRPAAPKTPEPAPKAPALPGVKELVSLRIDRDVLEHFQAEGPGWQERINEALRQLIGARDDSPKGD
jgi:uncharacterized protein (DUF4415 family)